MPQISLPDIKLPDIRFRDGRLRDVKLPDIDLRDHLPDLDLSKFSLPGGLRDISMPEISLSDVHMPAMHIPAMHLPDVNLRDLRTPKMEMPDFDMRRLDPRRIDLSGVDGKRLREFARFGRPAPKPASPLPWVIVAAVGGFFAGWWLATSPVTGPRVRQWTDRVRGRINDWRAGGADWDDDHAETLWSEHVTEQESQEHTLELARTDAGGSWPEGMTGETGRAGEESAAAPIGGSEDAIRG